ncbi:MAG: hypothetical protein HY432_02860 [Candidatus Liptonbacteria bacterium]|nr:hypothetical protein [Candidatus Liptonbacteria bacterium]
MSHIDAPERAALVKNKATVFWLAALIALVAMILIAAANFASNAGKPTGVTPGVYRQLVVGEKDEVRIQLPPRSWWDLDVDKPVIIRLANGEKYERRPDGSIFKIEASGALKPVQNVGDVIPGSVIYLTTKKGEKMAKVSVSTVRK